ncbi:MAG: uncharacterized protein H6Q89_1366 [Myxococcaceae bacterium]|nr:uncharacterized protein [Myxococcaceae bacterium]
MHDEGHSRNVHTPMKRALWLLLSALISSACDRVGRENGRGSAAPEVAAPRLSPVEIKPPKIERSVTGRVVVVDPPRIDATQIDLVKQADGIVDILWVIDDSGSMANQRKTLVNNFDRFLAALLTLKVSWQMGVTTTNALDLGKLRGTTKVIKLTTPDPKAVFEANTTFSGSRTRWEQGLRMAELAVTGVNIAPGGTNVGFLRPNAALAVIVVTDEDDSSFGTPDHFARVFRTAKGKGNEALVTFSTIAGSTPVGCTPAGEANYYGSLAEPAFRYASVSTKTGGVVGSICDASFEGTLVSIAEALNTLRRVFPLTLKPLLSSLTVRVNGAVIPQDPVSGWQYRLDTNSIVFLGTYIPPPGAILRLEYAFAK